MPSKFFTYFLDLARYLNQSLYILGYEVSVAHQYGAVCVASFPFFWLAGAGGAFFWVIGASITLILLHAIFYVTEEEAELFEVEVQEI